MGQVSREHVPWLFGFQYDMDIIVILSDRSSDRLFDNIETYSVLRRWKLHIKSLCLLIILSCV